MKGDRRTAKVDFQIMDTHSKKIPAHPDGRSSLRFQQRILDGQIVITHCPKCNAEWAYVISGNDVGCGHCFEQFQINQQGK